MFCYSKELSMEDFYENRTYSVCAWQAIRQCTSEIMGALTKRVETYVPRFCFQQCQCKSNAHTFVRVVKYPTNVCDQCGRCYIDEAASDLIRFSGYRHIFQELSVKSQILAQVGHTLFTFKTPDQYISVANTTVNPVLADNLPYCCARFRTGPCWSYMSPPLH